MSHSERPFSQACENNRGPILKILERVLADSSRVLEIGSGTGQHAVHFASRLPHLVWQTSDLAEHHRGINAWIDDQPLGNLLRPLLLDVDMPVWPQLDFDAVFTANTCHIMPWASVEQLFTRVGALLPPKGVFCVYGPFNYGGRYTSESNARFDSWLGQQAPHRAIRDFEKIIELAARAGLVLFEDCEMPANNRLIVWQRSNK